MLLSLSSVTNLNLVLRFCAACTLSYRCLEMEWWAALTVVAIPSQHALLMWLCVSAARLSVLSPRASRAILHSQHPVPSPPDHSPPYQAKTARFVLSCLNSLVCLDVGFFICRFCSMRFHLDQKRRCSCYCSFSELFDCFY